MRHAPFSGLVKVGRSKLIIWVCAKRYKNRWLALAPSIFVVFYRHICILHFVDDLEMFFSHFFSELFFRLVFRHRLVVSGAPVSFFRIG